MTTEEISRTHTFGDLVPLPQCDSYEANYYVRKGAYFTRMDYEQLSALIENCKVRGDSSVTLKCADEAVYEAMITELIDEQRIFNYLGNENSSIMYTDSPKQLSMTFWLEVE